MTQKGASTEVRTRTIAVLGATTAALAVWVLGLADGADFEFVNAGQTIPVGVWTVVGVTLVVAIAACGVAALLPGRARHPRAVWTWISLTVLVLSLPGLLAGEAETSTRVYLALIHIAVGAVLIPVLRRSLHVESPAASGGQVDEGAPIAPGSGR